MPWHSKKESQDFLRASESRLLQQPVPIIKFVCDPGLPGTQDRLRHWPSQYYCGDWSGVDDGPRWSFRSRSCIVFAQYRRKREGHEIMCARTSFMVVRLRLSDLLGIQTYSSRFLLRSCFGPIALRIGQCFQLLDGQVCTLRKLWFSGMLVPLWQGQLEQ